MPLAVDLGGELLTIRLIAAWDPGAVAADTVEGIAGRLGEWVDRTYQVPQG